MADTNELNVKGIAATTGTWNVHDTASFTIALNGTDHRAVLLVDNTDTELEVRATLEAGDGERAVLGALDVDIDAESVAAIPLTDSMRFKKTGKVTVKLTNTAGTALTAGALPSVKTVLIQG
jgi:hypothetical protein